MARPACESAGMFSTSSGQGASFVRKKPVPAPADVACHAAEAIDLDGDRPVMAMALDVFEGRIVLLAQFDANDADRRLEPMRAKADAAEMRERHGSADRGVTAHPEIADIVEEYQAGGAGRVDRLAENRADQRVVASRLEDREAPDIIELLGEAPGAGSDSGPRPQRRAAFNDEPGGLAFGMGIDNAHDASPFCAAPFGVPGLEEPQLRFGEALLAVAQGARILLKCNAYSVSPRSTIRCLKKRTRIGSFVESRQRGERAVQLESQSPRPRGRPSRRSGRGRRGAGFPWAARCRCP